MTSASHSEVETYLQCERKHYYRYGRKLDTIVMSDALFRGVCGHAGLQAMYQAIKEGIQDKETVQDLMIVAASIEAAMHEPYDSTGLIDQIEADLLNYIDNYWEIDKDLDVLAIEQRFDVQVLDDYVMPMIVDLVIRHPMYGIIPIDHKFVYDFFNPDQADVLPQLAKYLAGLKYSGVAVRERAMYNEIRTRVTQANKSNPQERFKRSIVNVNKTRMIRTMAEQVNTARRIVRLKKMDLIEWEQNTLRVADSMACKVCVFKDLCAAELSGNPTEDILREKFKTRTRREVTEVQPQGELDGNTTRIV